MLSRLFAALESAAVRLTEARAEERALARRAQEVRWRSARLLWPLFTKG